MYPSFLTFCKNWDMFSDFLLNYGLIRPWFNVVYQNLLVHVFQQQCCKAQFVGLHRTNDGLHKYGESVKFPNLKHKDHIPLFCDQYAPGLPPVVFDHIRGICCLLSWNICSPLDHSQFGGRRYCCAWNSFWNMFGTGLALDAFLTKSSALWPQGFIPYRIQTFEWNGKMEPIFLDDQIENITQSLTKIMTDVPCLKFQWVLGSRYDFQLQLSLCTVQGGGRGLPRSPSHLHSYGWKWMFLQCRASWKEGPTSQPWIPCMSQHWDHSSWDATWTGFVSISRSKSFQSFRCWSWALKIRPRFLYFHSSGKCADWQRE